MSLLGKLLLVVNLLAGAGFVYLAVQDWKGRQTITGAVARNMLPIRGLPLTGPETIPAEEDARIPVQVEIAGGIVIDTVSKKLLDTYFAQASGGGEGRTLLKGLTTTVPTQLAELRRVYNLLREDYTQARENFVKSSPNDVGKARALALRIGGHVRLQPRSYEERLAVLKLLGEAPPDPAVVLPPRTAADWLKAADELAHRLDVKFYQVQPALLPKVDGDGAVGDEQISALAPDLWKKLQAETPKRIAALTAQKEKLSGQRDNLETQRQAAEANKQAEEAAKLGGQKDRLQAQIGGIDQEIANLRLAPRDEIEQQSRLAHLLVHLDQDAAWQKRVAMVVGVPKYTRAVGEQENRFRDMITRVNQGILGDQAVFLPQYELLRQEALQKTLLVKDQADVLKRLREQAANDARFVKERDKQLNGGPGLKGLKAQLSEMKAEVDGLLARQTGTETHLFELQREVARALEEVYRLEAELEKTEKERYGPVK